MTTPLPPSPSDKPSSEPAQKIGAIVSVVTTAVGAAVVFGASKEQADELLALVAVIAAAAPYLTSLWIRMRVWSPASVSELVERLRRPGRLS